MSNPSTPLVAGALLAALVSPAAAQTLLADQAEHLTFKTSPVPGSLTGSIFGGFDPVVADDSGGMLFRGRIFGGGATQYDNRAYFYGHDAGSLAMILRSGDPEPSGTIPGAALESSSSAGLGSKPRIGADGTILFGTFLDDDGVSIAGGNDTALYYGTPGAFQLLAREGDVAPGTGGATYVSNFQNAATALGRLSANGTAVFHTMLEGGVGGGDDNDEAWMIGTPGAVSVMAREGDTLPTGHVIERLTPGGILQINSSELVLLDVEYLGGTGTPPATDDSDRALLIRVPGGGTLELIREGGPSPFGSASYLDPSGAAWLPQSSANSFNTFGDAILRVVLDGSLSDRGVVIASLAGQIAVARTGDAAPGVPGETFDDFGGSSLALTNSGRVAFQATLTHGAAINEVNDTGLWTGTPGSLELIAREGDAAPGTGGLEWGQLYSNSLSANDAGQLLFIANLVEPITAQQQFSVWYFDPEDGLRLVILNDGQLVDLGDGFLEATSTAAWSPENSGSSRPLGFRNDGTAELRMSYQSGIDSITKIRPRRLASSPDTISVATGGVHEFQLSGGSKRADNLFFLLGSASGTSPGTPVDGFLLPLNFDSFLGFTIDSANQAPLANTFGVLDELGRATASLTIPAGATGLAGLTLDFAYLSIDWSGPIPFLDAASNATSLSLIP